MRSAEEDCLPNFGFLKSSIVLGGDGTGEIHPVYPGYIHPEEESAFQDPLFSTEW